MGKAAQMKSVRKEKTDAHVGLKPVLTYMLTESEDSPA